jgi:hypothetical protein
LLAKQPSADSKGLSWFLAKDSGTATENLILVREEAKVYCSNVFPKSQLVAVQKFVLQSWQTR